MAISLHSRVAQAQPAPLSSEVDGEIVMLDVLSGCYYNLDPVGSDIWKRLHKETIVSDLCTDLESEYNATQDIIQKDVLAWLEKMLEKKLIVTVG